MLNKMLARLELSVEVRRALKVAREGVDGFRDEAEVAASIVNRSIDRMEPGYSAYCNKDAYIKSAKYRVYLKAAYPNAGESSISQAATDVAWADSRVVMPGMHEQNLKNARKSIEHMILEDRRSQLLKLRR